MGGRADVLDRVLTDIPPLIKHFADTKNLLINAIDSVGRLSQAADQYLSEARGPLHTDLQALQCPLKELGRASPYLIGAVKVILTQPFDIDTVPKLIRGDYMNVSLTLDTTLSAVDNAFLTGTGLSGALARRPAPARPAAGAWTDCAGAAERARATRRRAGPGQWQPVRRRRRHGMTRQAGTLQVHEAAGTGRKQPGLLPPVEPHRR